MRRLTRSSQSHLLKRLDAVGNGGLNVLFRQAQGEVECERGVCTRPGEGDQCSYLMQQQDHGCGNDDELAHTPDDEQQGQGAAGDMARELG